LSVCSFSVGHCLSVCSFSVGHCLCTSIYDF
jgi:hypothetical protein